MHDCRAAPDLLVHVYHAQLETVFDTAVAWKTLNDEDFACSNSLQAAQTGTHISLPGIFLPRCTYSLRMMTLCQVEHFILVRFDALLVTGGTTQEESFTHSTTFMP